MAKKSIVVSDLSGAQVEDGQGAQVVITTADARYELDVTVEEVESLMAVGRKVAKRGRKPKPRE